jgi:hypothetical protein
MSGVHPILPNFLGVGPPRTATTWLHGLLNGRANLPERVKETRFFDGRFWLGLDWYTHHFEHAQPGIPTGEIAPTYFYCAPARQRIAASLPDVRIIISLREPVERLYSLYTVKRNVGALRGSFPDALRDDPEMIESARYVFHLSGWLRVFGRQRVLVMIYEDLLQDPARYAQQIFDHIGLPRASLSASDFTPVHKSKGMSPAGFPALNTFAVKVRDASIAYGLERTRGVLRRSGAGGLVERMLRRSNPEIPSLDPELAARLREQFRGEVEECERILGRDLSVWKNSCR